MKLEERKTPLTDAAVLKDKWDNRNCSGLPPNISYTRDFSVELNTGVAASQVVDADFARRLERLLAEMAEVLGCVNVMNTDQWYKVKTVLEHYAKLKGEKG